MRKIMGGSAAVQPFNDQSRVLGEAHLQQQQQHLENLILQDRATEWYDYQ
jgi:hypothetical protein